MRDLRLFIGVFLQIRVVSRESLRRGALAPFTGGDAWRSSTLTAAESADASRDEDHPKRLNQI
jgi:hypothetical protein